MRIVIVAAALALATAAPLATAAEANAAAAAAAPVPAGQYTTDKAHTSLLFRVDHLGFSHFTGRFTQVDAKLQFDPAHIAVSRLSVDIDPRSISSDNAPSGFLQALAGAGWLDADHFPQMTFRSQSVEMTGPNTFRIHGELTLHGVTKPLILDARYNGGYAGHPMDPHARVGFSATGSLKRSDFGISFGIPAPGTTMGVGDQVDVVLESEFSGPPLVAQR